MFTSLCGHTLLSYIALKSAHGGLEMSVSCWEQKRSQELSTVAGQTSSLYMLQSRTPTKLLNNTPFAQENN